MRPEEITLESIAIEPANGHRDAGDYDKVCFRVFQPEHPNSFVVPISVNTDQYGPDEIEAHARFVFHHIFRALADATRDWDQADPRPV